MKARKKPVEIETFQLTKDNVGILADWCKGMIVGDNIHILTLEGVMTARNGDYIIKGVAGEFYPCAPAIFERTYEIINE
jgi:hypothetical protein